MNFLGTVPVYIRKELACVQTPPPPLRGWGSVHRLVKNEYHFTERIRGLPSITKILTTNQKLERSGKVSVFI